MDGYSQTMQSELIAKALFLQKRFNSLCDENDVLLRENCKPKRNKKAQTGETAKSQESETSPTASERKITDASLRFEEFLSIKQERERLKDELSMANILYESEVKLTGQLREDLEILLSTLDSRNEEITVLRNELSKLTSLASDQKLQIEQTLEYKKDLSQRNEMLDRQLTECQTQCDDLRRKSRDLEDSAHRLKLELERQREEMRILEESKADSQIESIIDRQQLEQKIKDLRADRDNIIAAARERINSLQAQKAEIITEARSRIQTLKQTNACLHTRVQRFETENAELNAQASRDVANAHQERVQTAPQVSGRRPLSNLVRCPMCPRFMGDAETVTNHIQRDHP